MFMRHKCSKTCDTCEHFEHDVPPADEAFAAIDTDRDGKIHLKELIPVLKRGELQGNGGGRRLS